MADEKKIRFGAEDSGFLAFIEKSKASLRSLQETSRGLFDKFASEAKKSLASDKEQYRFIQDQLKALKDQLSVEKEITKEKLEQAKALRAELRPDQPGFVEKEAKISQLEDDLKQKIKDLDDKRSQVDHAREIASRDRQDRGGQKSSFFADMLKADLFREMVSIIRQVPNARTGLDLVSPVMQAGGGLAGFGIGTMASLVSGNPAMAGIFGRLGKEAGGFVGDSIVRSRLAEDEYLRSLNTFRALTGSGGGVPGDRGSLIFRKKITEDEKQDFFDIGLRKREFNDKRFSDVGLTDAEALQLMTQASRIAGSGKGAESMAMMIAGLERGFGIERGDALSALETKRFGASNSLSNLQRTLGVAVAEGIDRTKMADAIKSQTTIFERFAGVKDFVSIDDVNRTIFEMNRLGGQFAIGDRRSLGNIEGINRGLSDPSSAFGQAQNLAVLRRLFPDESVFQLRMRQEQGLMTPGFLQAVLGDVMGGGGSEDFKKFQLKGRFPDLSFDAIDRLFKHQDQLGTMDRAQLSKVLGLSDVEGAAKGRTTVLQKEQAEIQNAFKDNFVLGISEIAKSFVRGMEKAGVEVAQAWRILMTSTFDPSAGKFDSKGRFIIKSDRRPSINGRKSLTEPDISEEQAQQVRDLFNPQ